MGSGPLAISTTGVSYWYKQRQALDHVELEVHRGEIFGLLGPNGGGKTTLFRLLTTHHQIQEGQINVLGHALPEETLVVRSKIGVVFQSPSLDGKLTVAENLKHHARLYGVARSETADRSRQSMEQLGLWDRRGDRVETLSGGLARRAELAKGMLHRPELLIMDEPSTGLDPGARRDLWTYLRSLREQGVSILLTTHLMEEAERCDRLAILDKGRIVAGGSPEQLRNEVGGEIVTLVSYHPEKVSDQLKPLYGDQVNVLGEEVRIEIEDAFRKVPAILEVVGETIESIAVAKPTLEDVFIHKTGHRFWDAEQS